MANPIAKTTRGKGRHFQSVAEGGGMTEAGRKAYNRATGSNLQAPAPNPRTPKRGPGSAVSARDRGRGQGQEVKPLEDAGGVR